MIGEENSSWEPTSKFGFRDADGRFILTKQRAWALLTVCFALIGCIFTYIIGQVTIDGDERAPVVLGALLAATAIGWLITLVRTRHL